MKIYENILSLKRKGRKQFAVLIDPDKTDLAQLEETIRLSVDAHVDFFLLGGSLIVNDTMDLILDKIKRSCDIPCILFPGNTLQITNKADGILLLSLISGRNPELLIGKHVIAAPKLRSSGMEIIPTGYILIDGGVETSVSYMSNTRPIPKEKTEIALCTALAGEMLGMQCIYLDAGSGAITPVFPKTIRSIKNNINVPLIIGGGIKTPEAARKAVEAGADIIVIGNAIEKDPNIIIDISACIHSYAEKVVNT